MILSDYFIVEALSVVFVPLDFVKCNQAGFGDVSQEVLVKLDRKSVV